MIEPTFQTRDTSLAVMLATCGVPFPRNAAGLPIPFFNIYDPSILRGYGYEDGQSLWDAATHAWKNGKRGRITYNFTRGALLDRLLKIWKQHGESMAKGDESDPDGPLLAGVTPEIAAIVCAQFAKNRKVLTESWRKAVPYVEFSGPVHSAPEGDGIVVTGSFKAISLNASPELRSAVGF
jgi:hypothetical protein